MTITQRQYWQAFGLLALADTHTRALTQIESALLEITQERECGHTMDAVFGDTSLDELLRKLNITVAADSDAEEERLA